MRRRLFVLMALVVAACAGESEPAPGDCDPCDRHSCAPGLSCVAFDDGSRCVDPVETLAEYSCAACLSCGERNPQTYCCW